MSTDRLPQRDERTAAVENASLSLGYKLMSFAILIDVIYRSYFLGDSSWDLLGIVIGTGLVVTVYQGRQRIITRGWVKTALLTGLVAAAVALMAAVVIFGR